jgi:nitrite reductase/ring-hydroxylating ferredoxin subunit
MTGPLPWRGWTPAGIPLGRLDDIPDGQGRFYRLEIDERLFQGLVVRRGGAVFGYVDRCPHAGVPLARSCDDDPLEEGCVQCCWHGARFDVGSGYCVSGPCRSRSLAPWPVILVEDRIVTA